MQITVTPRYNVSAVKGENPEAGFNHAQIDIVDAPALTGSEKQVAWAERIREEAILDMLDTILRRAGLAGQSRPSFLTDAHLATLAKLNEGAARLAADLATVTDARAWIDARGVSGKGNADTIRKVAGK